MPAAMLITLDKFLTWHAAQFEEARHQLVAGEPTFRTPSA